MLRQANMVVVCGFRDGVLENVNNKKRNQKVPPPPQSDHFEHQGESHLI